MYGEVNSNTFKSRGLDFAIKLILRKYALVMLLMLNVNIADINEITWGRLMADSALKISRNISKL